MDLQKIRENLKKYEEQLDKDDCDDKCKENLAQKIFDRKMNKFKRVTREIRRAYFIHSSYYKPSEIRRIKKSKAQRKNKRRLIKEMKKNGVFLKWVSQKRKGFKW